MALPKSNQQLQIDGRYQAVLEKQKRAREARQRQNNFHIAQEDEDGAAESNEERFAHNRLAGSYLTEVGDNEEEEAEDEKDEEEENEEEGEDDEDADEGDEEDDEDAEDDEETEEGDEEESDEEADGKDEEGSAEDFDSEVSKDRRKKEAEDAEENEDEEEGIGEQLEKVGQQFTGTLLKQSWLNLIPSWGLTYIYIFFHFTMRYMASFEIFAKPGMEFIPRQQTPPGVKVSRLKKAMDKIVEKTLGLGLELLEIIAFLFLTVIVGIILVVIVVFIYIIINCIGPGIFTDEVCRAFTIDAIKAAIDNIDYINFKIAP